MTDEELKNKAIGLALKSATEYGSMMIAYHTLLEAFRTQNEIIVNKDNEIDILKDDLQNEIERSKLLEIQADDRNRLASQLKQIKDKIKIVDKCPDCDNTGRYGRQGAEDEWEQVQCEFCWTNPNSVFNLLKSMEGDK